MAKKEKGMSSPDAPPNAQGGAHKVAKCCDDSFPLIRWSQVNKNGVHGPLLGRFPWLRWWLLHKNNEKTPQKHESFTPNNFIPLWCTEDDPKIVFLVEWEDPLTYKN